MPDIEYDHDTIQSLRAQHNCSARLARRILRGGVKPSTIEQRVADEATRSNAKLGGSITRLHNGGTHRGPRKGPSKRPSGVDNDKWRDHMRNGKPL